MILYGLILMADYKANDKFFRFSVLTAKEQDWLKEKVYDFYVDENNIPHIRIEDWSMVEDPYIFKTIADKLRFGYIIYQSISFGVFLIQFVLAETIYGEVEYFDSIYDETLPRCSNNAFIDMIGVIIYPRGISENDDPR